MACAEVVGFMKERNGRRSVVLLVRDGATTFHIPVPLADAQELAEEMLEAVEWARTGVQRMSDILVTLLDAIRAHGNDVDVYDDSIGYGRAWVLSDGRDVVDAVLRRIASETALVEDDG